MGHYSKNPLEADWDADELADQVSRTRAAEEEAGRLFEQATRRQKAEHDASLANLIGIVGPLWDRKREDIRAKWFNDTAQARILFDRSVAEILDAGEISQETYEAWDAIDEPQRPALRTVEAA